MVQVAAVAIKADLGPVRWDLDPKVPRCTVCTDVDHKPPPVLDLVALGPVGGSLPAHPPHTPGVVVKLPLLVPAEHVYHPDYAK